jgi:hypothetical protein
VTELRLSFDDVSQAKALHRMLMRRKFEGPSDEFFGSPIIADIQHQLLDLIVAAEPQSDWASWRQADVHTDIVGQIRRFIEDGSRSWPAMTDGVRRRFVKDLLAPLIPSTELVDDLTGLWQGEDQ